MLILQILFQKCREVDKSGRNLGLSERGEDSREVRNIIPPIQFELVDIKSKFVFNWLKIICNRVIEKSRVCNYGLC